MNQFALVLADVSSVCEQIPTQITDLTSLLYMIVKIAIPLILIIYGMLDFGRSVMAGEEKEIKEKQKLFIKRIIAAVMVFLVFSIVELVLGLVAGDDKESIFSCISKILGTN